MFFNSPRQARILQKRFSTLPPRMSWHQVPLTPGAMKVRTRCCWPTPQEREQELHSPHIIQEQFLCAHSGPWHTPPSDRQNRTIKTSEDERKKSCCTLRECLEWYTTILLLQFAVCTVCEFCLQLKKIAFETVASLWDGNNTQESMIGVMKRWDEMYRDTEADCKLSPVGSFQSSDHQHTPSYGTSEQENPDCCRFGNTDSTLSTGKTQHPHLGTEAYYRIYYMYIYLCKLLFIAIS